MDYNIIKNKLTDYVSDGKHLDVYVKYLKVLEIQKNKDGSLKNRWFKHLKEDQFTDIFIKVIMDDLYIDGDIVTLSFKGQLLADYSYQAYRKKLLSVYPETKIDSQVVYKDDKFSFEKQSGKIIYTHEFTNPFEQTDDDIIGAYCIVKNNKGEFIELLNKKEAEKMQRAAKTDNVWKSWRSRMYLKSVIKRLCKTFFYDSFKNIESIDNQNYDLDKVNEKENEESKKKAEIKARQKQLRDKYIKYNGANKAEVKEKYIKSLDNITIEKIDEIEKMMDNE